MCWKSVFALRCRTARLQSFSPAWTPTLCSWPRHLRREAPYFPMMDDGTPSAWGCSVLPAWLLHVSSFTITEWVKFVSVASGYVGRWPTLSASLMEKDVL